MKKKYPEVSARIMSELRSGAFKVGDVMPSEAALCDQLGTSRSTVRAALAELQRLGLIERKQGAPTRVLSTEPPPSYVHKMSATGDLMQFAGPSWRKVHSSVAIVADEDLADRLQDRPGRRWTLIRQTRHIEEQEVPVCWTDVYLCERYADIVSDIADYPGLIYSLLESRHDVIIREIRQLIRAVTIPDEIAPGLNAKLGQQAIELCRCYRDASGENKIITVSTLPAESYTYEIRLLRQI